jgi:hypothetical protein
MDSVKPVLLYMYSEGDWRYNRVLVDGEQAGFVAVNTKKGLIGKTAHHPNLYPNDAIYAALIKKMTVRYGRPFKLNRK